MDEFSWNGSKTFSSTVNRYYNFDDLNRENYNIKFLYNQFIAQGYTVTLPKPVVWNYTRLNLPKVTPINDARQNINALLELVYQLPIDVDTRRKQAFGYTEANKLEQSLQNVYDLFQSLIKGYKYCGTFYCGEEISL